VLNKSKYKFPYFSFLLIFVVSCGFEKKNESTGHSFKEILTPNILVKNVTRKSSSLPILSVIEPHNFIQNNLISFGFKSTKPGKISYSGSCISSTRNAIKGDHHIRFVAMVEGAYDDCSIQVTDSDGNKSEPLNVPTFSVDFTAPELTQIGDFKIEGRNLKLELISSESGNLVYSGNCNGDLMYVNEGKSKITILFPGDGQFSDCELYLADAVGNVSEPLSLGAIRIDTTPPALTEINPVPEKIQTDRPSYSFKTSKSGILSFSGKCKGNVDKAVAGINHIAFLANEPGIYNDCSLTLTDSAKNKSLPLKISPFEVLGNS